MVVEAPAPDVDTELSFMTAAERAYRVILEKLTAGELLPGTKLPRRKVAAMIGVSQIPVLEALKRLEQDGLVEYRARWGCVVTIPTVEKILDLYALREAIECQVARIHCQTGNLMHKAEMQSLARELDGIPYSSETENEITRLHHAFHMRLAELTGHRTLIDTLLRSNLLWLLWRGVRSRRTRASFPHWHEQLVEAVFSGDLLRADQAMREHILDAKEPLIQEMLGKGKKSGFVAGR